MVFKWVSIDLTAKTAQYTTDLYVDECFYETFTYSVSPDADTTKQQGTDTYKFSELRFLTKYGGSSSSYKVHSLQISNETATVERPTLTSASGFTVTDNVISTYAGKTVGDLTEAYTNAKVYDASGVEISDSATKLAPGMTVKATNTYGVAKLTDTYTLASVTPLAVNVNNFTTGKYFTIANTNSEVLTVTPNSSDISKILDGTKDLNLYEQINPLIVSFELESSGDMTSFRFFTDGSLPLTDEIASCANWKSGDKHKLTLVFRFISTANFKASYKSDLYIDDSFYNTYEYTDKDITKIEFKELRFVNNYKTGSENKYFKAHSLKVTNGNADVSRPTYTAPSGFSVVGNEIRNWNGKTVGDIIGTNNAKVYNASGVEVTEKSTALTKDMSLKAINSYDIIDLADTYVLADPSKVYVAETHLAATSNYRFAHWGRVNQSNKPTNGALENGVIDTGVVVPTGSTTNTSFFSMGLVSNDKAIEFDDPQMPIVVSMNVNPWGTNSTVTDESKNNVKAVGYFARNMGCERDDYLAYSDMVPVSELVQNTANNLTLVYYPNVSENMDRAVLFLNGEYYSEKYITSDSVRLSSDTNTDKQIRLLVDKVDPDKTSTIGVTDIYVYELNNFNELSLGATNSTIVGKKINGWYSFSKSDLQSDLTSDGISTVTYSVANESAVAKGDTVTVSVDYSSLGAGLRAYKRVYTLDEAYGDLKSMNMTASGTSVTLSAVGDSYVKDTRLDSVTVSKKLLMLAFYKGDELVGFTSKDVDVKSADKSLTSAIPENADKVRGFLWTNDNNATPITATVEKSLKTGLADTITCWGDSLTQGIGCTNGQTTSYPAVLASLTGKTVIKGETSMTIAARQGAVDIKLTKAVTIPTDKTPVEIEYAAYDSDGTYIAKFNPRNAAMKGWKTANIGGIEGTVTFDYDETDRIVEKTYFTRSEEGASVVLPIGTQWITPSSEDNSAINIFWTGTNGSWNAEGQDPSDTSALVNLIKKQISYTCSDKYIVVGLPYSNLSAANDALKAEFGEHFYDLKTYITSAQALIDAGVTATDDDTARIASGEIPPSLLNNYPADTLHFNDKGYNVIANQLYQKLISLGYVTENN